MRLAITMAFLIVLAMGGDMLLNEGRGTTAVQREITKSIGSLVD